LATWQELSLDCLQAAQKLLEAEHLRSSISRSYYAAYCAVTSELVARGVAFAHGWDNPAHDQLPDLILHNTALPRNARYELNKAIRRLRRAREDADYRPGVSLVRSDAINCLRDALFVMRILGAEDESGKSSTTGA
jgi:uncharacterized protein (UPF0332 family)